LGKLTIEQAFFLKPFIPSNFVLAFFFIQSIQEHFGFLLKFYNAQWLGNLKTTLLFDLPIENCK
jgi:hypothetical protein